MTEATEWQFSTRHMTVRGLGSYQSFSILDMGERWNVFGHSTKINAGGIDTGWCLMGRL